MANPSVQERLKTVSGLILQREDLREPLKLQKEILQIQHEIDRTPTKGTSVNWNDRTIIEGLLQKSLETKKPIVHFLDPTVFKLDILSQLSTRIAKVLCERTAGKKGLENFSRLMESGELDLLKLVEATLKADIVFIKKTAEKLELPHEILLYMLSVLVQPSLEEIARKIDSSLLDNWWQPHCPVCGRIPVIARLRDRKRYLVCTFCGAEYLSDSFLCVHCGNRDPYMLKYLVIQEQPAFQIDFCTKCKHYIKVIDETKLKENIPRGLEDIITLGVDFVAKKANLER
ncbi:formate dehydrogenase accessory protein FdhE [Candidatus Bathyarchaeota archaeon]|nr:formate dehydrogenase accessory protein FdhE [Candidatus Bathyarchaeota archaeon]